LRQGRPSVIDATAGLGRDAFQLACLGCRVRTVERSPILATMLKDALAQASRTLDQKLTAIVERITVISDDSRIILSSLSATDQPDVVYLDPMYTPRTSSALAKKEMRILRMLVGGDEDSGELLRIARAAATKRVVVKRHLRAPPLAEDVTMSYPGRTVRYDVYAGRPGP
ncbi:MAG: class I SAM-dependent methyltransferase, partial [Fibrobacterota bacterium]